MFEEEFDFPEDYIYDDEDDEKDQSKNTTTDEGTVSTVKPMWFLEDTGHPEGFPQTELEMSRAFTYYREG